MRLIVLGDLHFSDYENPDQNAARDRFFEGFFRQVAAHHADLVIAIGDTTDHGYGEEFVHENSVTRQAGLDLWRITGNHDTYNLPKSEIARFFLGHHVPFSVSDLYTSFDAGLVRFVLLDTTRSRDENWSGFVSDEQLAWLNGEIANYNQAGPPFLVVMGHHPITGTTRFSDRTWHNIEDSGPIKAEFARLTRPPAFYVCGHNHANSLVGPDAQGWHYVQLGAPLVCRSYGLFTFDPNGVRFETVDLDLSDPAFRADYETICQAQGEEFNSHPFEEMYGQDADHHLLVSV